MKGYIWYSNYRANHFAVFKINVNKLHLKYFFIMNLELFFHKLHTYDLELIGPLIFVVVGAYHDAMKTEEYSELTLTF